LGCAWILVGRDAGGYILGLFFVWALVAEVGLGGVKREVFIVE
jgi:hypothetical protein